MVIVLICHTQLHGIVSIVGSHLLLARFWMLSLNSLLLWFMVHFSHESFKSVRCEVFCRAVLLRQLIEKVYGWILLKRLVLLELGLVNWWTDTKLRGFSWNRHCHLACNNSLVSIGIVWHGRFSYVVWIIRAAYPAIISGRSLLILIHSLITISWVLLVAMLGRSATLIKPIMLLITPIGERSVILLACSALAKGGQFSSTEVWRMASLQADSPFGCLLAGSLDQFISSSEIITSACARKVWSMLLVSVYSLHLRLSEAFFNNLNLLMLALMVLLNSTESW